LFFGVPLQPVNLLGGLIGVGGVALLFLPELRAVVAEGRVPVGIALAVGATVSASLGNMVATRNHRAGVPILQLNGWSMLYGALITGVVAAALGQHFVFDGSWRYLGSWAYLVIFGSVLAFGAYLTLMQRIGAHRAGYAMVAIPVVALLISTGLEQLQWTANLWAGVALCVIGNVLVLGHRAAA